MKAALGDKSLPVQRAAAVVHIFRCVCRFSELIHFSGLDCHVFFKWRNQLTLSDLEAVDAQCTNSLDFADQVARHAHAQLVGHLLASTQIERVIPTPEASKKGKKDQGSEQHADDISSSIHAAAEITKSMLTLNDMLSLLSVQFHKFHGSRKTRIGIFDIYAALLTKLGASFVESHYSPIILHLLGIVVNLRSVSSRYNTLLVRSWLASFCGIWSGSVCWVNRANFCDPGAGKRLSETMVCDDAWPGGSSYFSFSFYFERSRRFATTTWKCPSTSTGILFRFYLCRR